ncbi:hypothetical protein SJS51_05100 [Aeromonas caviae]|uniref:hypothetical protein n=1 Tax=Aeromonas caviae TaxID=648 RepID=UPI0029D5C1C6|nr:hypothetical protein [Aeromonas caviae]MDX7842953.1 hypothetical protein [Aeromonas caviae]
MKMKTHSRALACVALALALGACSQSAPRKPVTPAKPVAPQPAVVVPQQDPDAVVQSAVAEPSPVFDEEYHGPDQGSLESVTALFARGYIESAMRETMLAAVHSDYPLLGMRDVRLTDHVAKFLTSAQARTTAHDYLYAGVQRRLGRPLSPAQWEQIWQGYPQQGRVSDWVKQTKRVLAGR